MKKRLINRRLIVAGISSALAYPAVAQEVYPARSVRIIVPFAAGGGADAVARALAQKLSERLGQQFIIDNRPGGAGNIGTEAVARAAPDGYTLLLTGPSHITNAHLFKNLPFDPLRGFAPISLLTSAPYVLVANPALPVRGFQDLVALARTSTPTLSYGSAGNGTAGHLAMEMIKAALNIDLLHVPYRGSPPLLADLMAGRVAVGFDNVISSGPAIANGQLRAIAVSGATRAVSLPDVPKIAESGLPGFNVTVWQGVLFPVGVEQAISNRLAAEISAAMQAPEVRARLDVLGVQPIGSNAAQFASFLEVENRQWGEVIRQSGARVD